MTTKEGMHTSLDVIGILLEPADALNAVLYLMEGDKGNAVLSGISMLPFMGEQFGKAGKGTKKYLLKAADATKLNRNEKFVKMLDNLDIFIKARKADIEDIRRWMRSLDNLADGGGYVIEYVTPDGLIYKVHMNDDFRVNINLMDEAGDTLQDSLRLGKRINNGGEVTEDVIKGESKILLGHGKWIKYTDDMKKYIIPPSNGYDAYLERVYIEIRKLGLDDIPIISKNTGLSEDDLIKLKEHIFLKTHYLSVKGEPLKELYFQADSEIAYAWQKAMKGELTFSEKQWFKQLLDHELTESALMENGMPLRDPSTYSRKGFLRDPIKNAHDKANLTAPQPSEFPGHDYSKDFLKYMDDEIIY